jgi:hypothetical protein
LAFLENRPDAKVPAVKPGFTSLSSIVMFQAPANPGARFATI